MTRLINAAGWATARFLICPVIGFSYPMNRLVSRLTACQLRFSAFANGKRRLATVACKVSCDLQRSTSRLLNTISMVHTNSH